MTELLERIALGDGGSLFELQNKLWDRGIVADGAAEIVPVLWEIVEAPDRGIHDGIAALLSLLAQGESRTSIAPVREAIWRGAPVAVRLLASGEEAVQRGAAAVLACFPEHRDETLPRLREALARPGSSAEHRAMLGLGLAALGEFDKSAFAGSKSEFVKEAKVLAQEAASGNADSIATALDVLCDAAPDDDDLSSWM